MDDYIVTDDDLQRAFTVVYNNKILNKKLQIDIGLVEHPWTSVYDTQLLAEMGELCSNESVILWYVQVVKGLNISKLTVQNCQRIFSLVFYGCSL